MPFLIRLARTGARLRAHAKTHKSPVVAKLQMARGAIGQCVQKVGEAEALLSLRQVAFQTHVEPGRPGAVITNLIRSGRHSLD